MDAFAAFLGKIAFIAALLLACAHFAKAEPITGQDYLAAQLGKFDTKTAQRFLKVGDATGNLDHTFGDDLESVQDLLYSHPAYHRVHIINTVCVRNGNCGKYELGYGYTKQGFDKAVAAKKKSIIEPFRRRVRLYCNLFQAFPGTKLLLSPALEHDLSKKSYRVLVDSALEACPGVQIVNSPGGGVEIERYRGALIERHDTNPQSDADIVSLDGAEGSDINVDAFLKRTNRPRIKIRFVWSRVFNCRPQGAFVDPRKRTSCPTEGNFEELVHLFDDRGPKPAKGFKPMGCSKVQEFSSPRIWKPMAEDNGSGDPRRNKPVVLIGSKVPNLEVLAKDGSVVGILPLYKDPHPHDLERYYSAVPQGSNVNGYEFEKRAMDKTGSPFTWLRAGSCLGPMITGQRGGTYK